MSTVKLILFLATLIGLSVGKFVDTEHLSFAVIAIIAFFSRSEVHASEDEERLVRDLFRGYNKLIRPVQNMTQTVDVRFGLAFVQLINVVSIRVVSCAHYFGQSAMICSSLIFQNEKNQIMKSNVWLRLVWNDYQLQWDESEYGGIGVLRLPPDKVWKPDIVLFNK